MPSHKSTPGSYASQDWLRIKTIDAHTEGEPLRVITDGFPGLPGDTILEKRRFARKHHDSLRCALMHEPRGHADMYGCLLVEPTTPDGDVGVLFLHNEGYSTMCGHGIIGLTKVGLDFDLFQPKSRDKILIDTPAGRVIAFPSFHPDGRVDKVDFENVPSFVLHQDITVEVDLTGLATGRTASGARLSRRQLRLDVAFGGAFYAYVETDVPHQNLRAEIGLKLHPENYRQIIDLGMRIKEAVMANVEIQHPSGDPDLGFLYGTILVERHPDSGPAGRSPAHSRNVCIFADGEVDRCPTGTGVSGRVAIHQARDELLLDQRIEIESLLGSRFEARVTELCTLEGGTEAVVPCVSGRAWVTGQHEFWIDPEDPFREGFLLR